MIYSPFRPVMDDRAAVSHARMAHDVPPQRALSELPETLCLSPSRPATAGEVEEGAARPPLRSISPGKPGYLTRPVIPATSIQQNIILFIFHSFLQRLIHQCKTLDR
jgi:hypothetical protein